MKGLSWNYSEEGKIIKHVVDVIVWVVCCFQRKKSRFLMLERVKNDGFVKLFKRRLFIFAIPKKWKRWEYSGKRNFSVYGE